MRSEGNSQQDIEVEQSSLENGANRINVGAKKKNKRKISNGIAES